MRPPATRPIAPDKPTAVLFCQRVANDGAPTNVLRRARLKQPLAAREPAANRHFIDVACRPHKQTCANTSDQPYALTVTELHELQSVIPMARNSSTGRWISLVGLQFEVRETFGVMGCREDRDAR
jgi:hypothetical protein